MAENLEDQRTFLIQCILTTTSLPSTDPSSSPPTLTSDLLITKKKKNRLQGDIKNITK